ncbi:peptidyl-prolyl cis-trans isomerase [Firmicutes bacterium CAG:449]|nr:peptidyl-prolyl cis-trans isomerase [Firmicutes bacterium CAG:449]
MDVVDRIANVKTSRNDKPLENVVIESVEVIDEPIIEVSKIK